MFIARFNQVSPESKSFKENKKGLLPFIGTVVAGTATATIIDGSIFKSEGLTTGQLYLCDNGVREYEGAELPTVMVIGALTTMESITVLKELGLGTGRVIIAKQAAKSIKDEKPAAPVATTVVVEAEPVEAATASAFDL